ncbi:MAG: 4-alpha-glucanotransferase [Bacilli bacterium]|nr:4-alpha-glucanotransferase [Bacilli bacterium]
MDRASGILMHISSLPSNYFIGSLGKEAEKFASFLHDSGQKYWQILPLNPIDAENSPYSSSDSFAGNIYLIDIEKLVEDNFLELVDLEEIPISKMYITDYKKAREIKDKLLLISYNKFKIRNKLDEYEEFVFENKSWLNDYALFMSLFDYFKKQWDEWPLPLVKRNKKTILEYQEKLEKEIDYYKYVQYLFYKQYNDFKNMLKKYDIKLIGDIPMYVSYNSVDVWKNQKSFLLNQNRKPKYLSGASPDSMSVKGQLWGNPIYDYNIMRKNNYKFWRNRIKHASRLCDVLRIDHFRAFDSYYIIPSHNKDASKGHYIKGEGKKLLDVIIKSAKNCEIIAEDLGDIPQSVMKLRNYYKIPGMKILQFAFNNDSKNPYLPHNYEKNCVAYLGTHDNEIISRWWNNLDNDTKRQVYSYSGIETEHELNRKLMKLLSRSNASLVIFSIQDVIGDINLKRMNTPGIAKGNWGFMLNPNLIDESIISYLSSLSKLFNR